MTDDVARKVQAAYDQIALVYAQSNHGSVPADLERLARSLVHRCAENDRLIDIGCGTGRDMAWFEARGLDVTGVDRSDGMLAHARRSTRGNLVAMDMRRLAFGAASFDAAWCCASLLHLPRSQAPLALAEIRRVLKRDATFVLSMQEGVGEHWEPGYDTEIERFFARYHAPELEHMLDAARFDILDMRRSPQLLRTWLTFLCVAR